MKAGAAPPGDGRPDEPLRLPELLSPAGDWTCVRAAVENGADAVYFGLSRFNARMRAKNFTEADLPELMRYLHRRGVRGYVSFNTLVFGDELTEAELFVRHCLESGVDAAIVQDVGICRLIRRLSGDFPIHASTQMTVTSAAGVRLARELGCERVVLARECSLQEIGQIQAAQREWAPGAAPLPIEVFVHGALCVAYSGQCLTSEALGGRSANRGECAQACRLPYALVADGRTVELGDRRYLLSPQDLLGIECLPQLARLGVASLKIEGRLKAPEYVANVTRAYREALDQVAADAADGQNQTAKLSAAPWRHSLEMAFSRGFHPGWFEGIDNQRLVHGRFGKKRGVLTGEVLEVLEVRGATVRVRLQGLLKPGDGVVFDGGAPDLPEEGGRVYGVRRTGNEAEVTFGRGDLDLARIRVGQRMWKTSDPELERLWRQSYAGEQPKFQRPLAMEVAGRVNEPLSLRVRDEEGRTVELESGLRLQAAERQPLDDGRLRVQLGRLGGTPFRLETLVNRLEGPLMLPVSELNRLRRAAVETLERRREQGPRWEVRSVEAVLPGLLQEGFEQRTTGSSGVATVQGSDPRLIVLVRAPDQLEAAIATGVGTIYCEFEDPKLIREALARHRSATGPGSGAEIWVVPPRITKPGEDWILRQVRSSEAEGCLVRNADQLEFFRGHRCVGDHTLNVANPLSAAWWMGRPGFERVTVSHDLNNLQIEALLRGAPPEWFEVVIHQRMPMFHMEHCVFCAFLSNGTDYRNCGRPCEKHAVGLRDRVGAVHPVKADAGCRNTVFHALAQTGAEYVPRLIELGVRHFRLEFLDEPPGVVTRTVALYQQLFRGEIRAKELWRELKARHQLGVTRGTLDDGGRPVTVL